MRLSGGRRDTHARARAPRDCPKDRLRRRVLAPRDAAYLGVGVLVVTGGQAVKDDDDSLHHAEEQSKRLRTMVGLQCKATDGDLMRLARRAMVSIWFMAEMCVIHESGVAHAVCEWRGAVVRGVVNWTCTGPPPSAADILVGWMWTDRASEG